MLEPLTHYLGTAIAGQLLTNLIRPKPPRLCDDLLRAWRMLGGPTQNPRRPPSIPTETLGHACEVIGSG